jgi:hypothetical protein
MPGAYRDDREAARAKIAELQAELDAHRSKRVAITTLKKQTDAIANRRQIPWQMVILLAVVGITTLLSLTVDILLVTWVLAAIFAALGIFVALHSGIASALHQSEDEVEERRVLLQAAEAKHARVELDRDQTREIKNEDTTIAALEEEIDQMRKLLEP